MTEYSAFPNFHCTTDKVVDNNREDESNGHNKEEHDIDQHSRERIENYDDMKKIHRNRLQNRKLFK